MDALTARSDAEQTSFASERTRPANDNEANDNDRTDLHVLEWFIARRVSGAVSSQGVVCSPWKRFGKRHGNHDFVLSTYQYFCILCMYIFVIFLFYFLQQ